MSKTIFLINKKINAKFSDKNIKKSIFSSSMRPVELLRDNRSKEILAGIQDAIRVRYKGFRSMMDLRESVKQEIMQTRSKMAGLAQASAF
jgi:hypothetical protein